MSPNTCLQGKSRMPTPFQKLSSLTQHAAHFNGSHHRVYIPSTAPNALRDTPNLSLNPDPTCIIKGSAADIAPDPHPNVPSAFHPKANPTTLFRRPRRYVGSGQLGR